MKTDQVLINAFACQARDLAARAPFFGPCVDTVNNLHDILTHISEDLEAVNARISELHPIDDPAPDARPIARAPSVSAQLAANRLRLSDIHTTLSGQVESLGARVTDLEASSDNDIIHQLKAVDVDLSDRIKALARRVKQLRPLGYDDPIPQLKAIEAGVSAHLAAVDAAQTAALAAVDTRLTNEINDLQATLRRRMDSLGDDVQRLNRSEGIQ